MTQLTVSIENPDMLRDIKKAIKMIRGVVSVKTEKPKPNPVTLAAIKELIMARASTAALLTITNVWLPILTMFDLSISHQYKRDLKLARKRGLDEALLDNIILLLIQGKPLPAKNKDHTLKGDYKGCRECHITPDWLLIYSVDNGINLLTLVRKGSHSDLF